MVQKWFQWKNRRWVTLQIAQIRELEAEKQHEALLAWEAEMLDFKAEDVQLRIRDFQLLRVTKYLQETIQGNRWAGWG